MGKDSETAGAKGSPASAKKLVSRFFEEVWNRRNLAAFPEFVDDDFVTHDARGGATRGIEAFRSFTAAFLEAVPDYRIDLLDVFAEGGRVAVRWVCHGTHAGAIMGLPATGRRFSLTGISIYGVRGGKISEVWRERDFPSTWRELLPDVEFTAAGLPKAILPMAAAARAQRA